MKRIFLAIVAAFVISTSAYAQRLTDIVAEARFITDKMVIELGLTPVQRNNIYNINLTYLDGINSYRDLDAHGWKYRNKQLKAMMSAKQWKKFKDSYYFYRPISWRNNAYVHNIYAKYPKHFDDRNLRPRPRPECHFGKPDACKHKKQWKDCKDCKKQFGNDKKQFGNAKREFNNNSQEAIRQRQEMRRGVMNGAR